MYIKNDYMTICTKWLVVIILSIILSHTFLINQLEARSPKIKVQWAGMKMSTLEGELAPLIIWEIINRERKNKWIRAKIVAPDNTVLCERNGIFKRKVITAVQCVAKKIIPDKDYTLYINIYNDKNYEKEFGKIQSSQKFEKKNIEAAKKMMKKFMEEYNIE